MINLKTSLLGIGRAIAIALIVVTLIFSLPALASPYVPKDTTVNPTAKDSSIAAQSKQRIESVEDCRKYLANGDKDTTASLDKPLDRSGSKTLVGALKVSDNPAPTVAEVEFKRCLEQKGIAPKP